MRSGNPALNSKTFDSPAYMAETNPMTIGGVVNKTFVMLLLVMATAVYTWNLYLNGGDVGGLLMVGAIGGLVVALITIFKPKVSPYTAPIYALLEGLVVGGLSAMYEAQFEGITIQAVMLTFSVLFALLLAYKSRLIKVTQNFRLGVFAATGAIFFVYLINIVLRFFGMSVPFLHDAGPIGIGISVVIVIVAALNLVLDFDFIEQGVNRGAPKYMEWYGAFGLMVTLIWLYIEILRLLAKLRRR